MNLKSRLERTIGIALILTLTLTPLCLGQHPAPKKTNIKNHIMYTMLEPGEIPAIFEPDIPEDYALIGPRRKRKASF